MDKSTFVAKCMEIKAKISVSKDNMNDFGGYKYRTIEDILAVAKPVLVGTGIELQTDVDVSIIGDKFLVIAYATLTDGENRETTKGLAFYDADHKKMSDEQKLGSASTYAIRYAMTNLLLAGSGEADLDSLPPKDYKGQQNGQRTQQAAATYQAPRSQYQQRPAQAQRSQYQQQAPARQQTAAPQQPASTTPAPAQRQRAAAPARQQSPASTAQVRQQAAPQQAAPTRQQVTAAPAPQVTAPSVPASQAATPQKQQAPAQSSGRIPMHEIKPGYDLTGQVKDIYKIQPGKEPIYGPYSPQACIFQYDSKGRALRPKACIITREEDES